MLDYNVIYGVLVAAALVVLIILVFPSFKDRETIYTQVKTGLLMFGYAFRDEKVKAMTDTIFNIVMTIEQLDKSGREKQAEALNVAFVELMDQFNVQLDKEAMQTIINIAVSYLPPTHSIPATKIEEVK